MATHYVDGRTKGCSEDASCPHCKRQDCPARWEGYVWGIGADGAISIVVVTAEAYRTCPELQDGQTDLAGRRITLTRQGSAANSQVRATVGGQQLAPGRAREPGDLYEYLCELWREKGGRNGTPADPE